MQQIISVPTVHSLKLPPGEWLNLALIRRLQFELEPPSAIVTWSNGDSQLYNGDQALAIVEAWEEATAKISGQFSRSEREVMEVLRRRGGEMYMTELVTILPDCFPALNTLRGRGAITFADGGASSASSSSVIGEDVVVQGLLAFGATDALIVAVLKSDEGLVEQALTTIEDQHERDRLTEIVQRLGVIQGKAR